MSNSAIKTFRTFYDPIEANIVKGRLEASGIECFVANENAFISVMNLTNARGGVSLMLKEADFEKAEEVLGDEGGGD